MNIKKALLAVLCAAVVLASCTQKQVQAMGGAGAQALDTEGAVAEPQEPIHPKNVVYIKDVGGLEKSVKRSRESIYDVVLENMPSLRNAYRIRLRDRPNLSGTVTVKFAIDEFGAVIFAEAVESKSTTDDPVLEGHVVEIVKSWEFGPIDKPEDVTEVVFPFVFQE